MSIESEIQRLNDAKSDIASAIEEYGVSVASDVTLDEYGNLVRSISIPTQLPNPNALTFTGAVSAAYDGSSPVTVEIPDGGSDIEVDSEITENSENPVTSSAIFAALAGKGDKTVHMWKRSKPTKTTVSTAGEQSPVVWENVGTEDAEYFTYNEDGSVSVLKKGKYLLISQLRLSTSTSGGLYGSIYAYVNGVQMETNPFTCYSLVMAGTTLYVSFPQLTTVFDLAAGDNVLIKGKGHPDAGYTITDTAGFFMLMYLGE